MNPSTQDPKDKEKEENQSGYQNPPDQTPRREGGDGAIAETNPLDDSRADERVIVNEQRESKAVNIPSQTAAHVSEISGNDNEVI